MLCALVCASSQAHSPAASYVLRLKWTKGKPVHLKVSTTVSGFERGPTFAGSKNGSVTFTGSVKITVQDIEETGATVHCESGPFLLPSGDLVLAKSISTQRVDIFGATHESGDFFGPQFPKESVKTGSTWKGTDPLASLKNIGSKAAASYRLLSVRTVAGRRVGDVSFETHSGNGLREGRGKLSIDMATGRLISAVGAYEIVDSQAAPSRTLHMAVTVVRVP